MEKSAPKTLTRRAWLVSALATLFSSSALPAFARRKFRRVPTQYIAALAPENAMSGTGAEKWGYWREDPGPIGVFLRNFPSLKAAAGKAPAGWQFDTDDWWLDENGILMKAPDFPMPAGQYVVTGGREVAAILTVETPDANGNQNWSLSNGAQIHEVTHGPCRSARYTPQGETGTCTPANADQSVFPLKPGAQPPAVADCSQQIYAVLIVIGLPIPTSEAKE